MPLFHSECTTTDELIPDSSEDWVTAERQRIGEARAAKRAWLRALGLRGPEPLPPDALRRVVQFGAVVEAAARRRAA